MVVSEVYLKSEKHTYREIYEQARICQVTFLRAEERLQEFFKLLPLSAYTDIIFTGCGSSLHLGRCAASAWSELLDRPVWALPASELLYFAGTKLRREARPLVFALSRTGGTTETVLAATHLREAYAAATVAVTTEPDSEMASLCDLELVFTECGERSVVMTGSFTAILYGMLLLADGITGEKYRDRLSEVPSLLTRALIGTERICRQLAADRQFKRFVFLGSGPMIGLAHEAALKLTEMALEPASVYPTLEFRHGPIAALNSETLVTMMPVEVEMAYVPMLIDEVIETGAQVLVVNDEPLAIPGMQRDFQTGLPEIFRPVMFAHVGQLLAFWRAVECELNPDAPPHLRRTVTLGNQNVALGNQGDKSSSVRHQQEPIAIAVDRHEKLSGNLIGSDGDQEIKS